MWWILEIIGYAAIGTFTMIAVNAWDERISLLKSATNVTEDNYHDYTIIAGLFWPITLGAAIAMGLVIAVGKFLKLIIKLIVKLCGG
jgi:hypothetical protein